MGEARLDLLTEYEQRLALVTELVKARPGSSAATAADQMLARANRGSLGRLDRAFIESSTCGTDTDRRRLLASFDRPSSLADALAGLCWRRALAAARVKPTPGVRLAAAAALLIGGARPAGLVFAGYPAAELAALEFRLGLTAPAPSAVAH